MSQHHIDSAICPLCELKLETAHERLRTWFYQAKSAFPDLHISWAWRGKEDQEKAFNEHKTTVHFPHSKHNFKEEGKPCSLALDVFQLKEGKAIFSPRYFYELNQFNQENGHALIWGNSFHPLVDTDHFELAFSTTSLKSSSKVL